MASTTGNYGIKILVNPQKTSKDIEIDIVFVHGLTGNRETTWTEEKSKTFWPRDLLPSDIPSARIMTFGYDADVVHFWSTAGNNRIGEHASSLVTALANTRDRSYTSDVPIFFVAHSLGGLVCEDALLNSKNSADAHRKKILASARGIAFLGTPHHGSDLANWASLFGNFASLFKSTNKAIVKVLQPDSEVLARIQRDFHAMLRDRSNAGYPEIRIACFFEELAAVVPSHSAVIPGYESASIHANHMDMTKFSSEEDAGYQTVSTSLWRWSRDLHDATAAAAVAAAEGTPGSDERGSRGPLLIEYDRPGPPPFINQGESSRTGQGGNTINAGYMQNTGKIFQGRDVSGDVNFG